MFYIRIYCIYTLFHTKKDVYGSLFYSRGYFNNCSHYFNLFETILGKFRGGEIIGDCKTIPIDWIKTNKHLDYYKDRYGVDLQQNRCKDQKGSGIYAPDTGDINEGIKICNIKVDPRTINGVNDLKVKKWVNLVTKWLVSE